MTGEPEDFEQLRRLLALKRYEQPPPGYFNHFSRDVIARIRAGDSGESLAEARFGNSWFRKLSALLEIRPALAGTFGVAVCGFLVIAGIYTEPAENAASNNGLLVGSGMAVVPAEHALQLGSNRLLPVTGSLSGLGTRGLPGESPLLDGPRVQPVLYTVPH